MTEMHILDCGQYKADVSGVAALAMPWEKLRGASLVISGGTGLIGSFLVDVIMALNASCGLDCQVYILGRNKARAQERFGRYDAKLCHFISHDINLPLDGVELPDKVDFVVHLASNTHPVAYATEPISTITTNIIGTNNMLDFARRHGVKRFAFASSNEIYGENRGDSEFFDEKYCGFIDCNTLRAGYPESKRCGEALCNAYMRQYGLDAVIPRFTRTYGPTLLSSDTKAMSQFLHKALAGEDIVLKSAGTQYYSYTYVADAVSGFLTVLLCGESGQAYNISDVRSDIMLKDLAAVIAGAVGHKVVFELPDSTEAAGFSKATKARLDSAKLQALGWKAAFDIETGIRHTLGIMKEMSSN